jgi:serine/threonine protein kinase
MHFLHSSGIVHRDLKSLNLLLDAKWNVKVLLPSVIGPFLATSAHDMCGCLLQVSDFGLTKFKSDMALGGGAGADNKGLGTIHWTAPEVLNETHDIDHVLADVYSFGIILWELLTRQQPYLGLRCVGAKTAN